MTRANPFRGLRDMSTDMDRMRRLGKTGSEEGFARGYERYERTHADAWAPAIDVFCRGGDLVICLEVPGLSREDVEVTVSHGALTVSGERATAADVPDDAFWQRERPYGTFRRTIALPEQADEQRMSATTRNGLLVITVTAACADRGLEPRQIPISDGSTT